MEGIRCEAQGWHRIQKAKQRLWLGQSFTLVPTLLSPGLPRGTRTPALEDGDNRENSQQCSQK